MCVRFDWVPSECVKFNWYADLQSAKIGETPNSGELSLLGKHVPQCRQYSEGGVMCPTKYRFLLKAVAVLLLTRSTKTHTKLLLEAKTQTAS